MFIGNDHLRDSMVCITQVFGGVNLLSLTTFAYAFASHTVLRRFCLLFRCSVSTRSIYRHSVVFKQTILRSKHVNHMLFNLSENFGKAAAPENNRFAVVFPRFICMHEFVGTGHESSAYHRNISSFDELLGRIMVSRDGCSAPSELLSKS
jgi:hypothetical protein